MALTYLTPLRRLFKIVKLSRLSVSSLENLPINSLKYKQNVRLFTSQGIDRSNTEKHKQKNVVEPGKTNLNLGGPDEKPIPLLSQLFSQTATNDPEQMEKERQKEEEENRKEKENAWKKMKIGFAVFGISMTIVGSCLVIEYGMPAKDEEGNIIEDEFSGLPAPKQYVYRLWNAMMFYQKLIKEPSRKHLLPDPLPYPYIQPPYTLVLELTDVLVHPDWTYQTGWRFKKRPGLDHFLEQVAPPLFEIVIFTAEQGQTAFPIIDALDPNGYVMYRLVRDATHFVDGHHVKNLDNLNRDLSKVIVVDWNAKSVKFHPENTLRLAQWKGNDDDTTLVDLAAFLKTIASSEVADVRDVLNYYQQFDNPVAAFRENQRKLIEQLEEEEQSKVVSKPLTTKWNSSFLKH